MSITIAGELIQQAREEERDRICALISLMCGQNGALGDHINAARIGRQLVAAIRRPELTEGDRP